jgi:hypothetical protein
VAVGFVILAAVPCKRVVSSWVVDAGNDRRLSGRRREAERGRCGPRKRKGSVRDGKILVKNGSAKVVGFGATSSGLSLLRLSEKKCQWW